MATFRFVNQVKVTVKADSLDDARVQAQLKIEDNNFDIDDFDMEVTLEDGESFVCSECEQPITTDEFEEYNGVCRECSGVDPIYGVLK